MTEEEIIKKLKGYIQGDTIYDTQLDYLIKSLLGLYNKEKEELEIEKRYSKFYENMVKEYKKVCIQKNKEIEELKQEIKDITCIPQDDIRYDEDGNELLED